MLQQTQVARVMKFYPLFIKKFPNFKALAWAKTADVLRAWAGMGYNRRALALQNLSRIVLEKYNGRLPRSREELEALPGIGKATAGSIRAFAWNEPEVFIETNIRRVFIHFFFSKRAKVTDVAIARYIESTVPPKNARDWYWALMDYGAMLAKADNGIKNPNHRSAHYKKQPAFKGSDRALRGSILRSILVKGRADIKELSIQLHEPTSRIQRIVSALEREGFAQ
jgi:A/G-specific adenine glycosylase